MSAGRRMLVSPFSKYFRALGGFSLGRSPPRCYSWSPSGVLSIPWTSRCSGSTLHSKGAGLQKHHTTMLFTCGNFLRLFLTNMEIVTGYTAKIVRASWAFAQVYPVFQMLYMVNLGIQVIPQRLAAPLALKNNVRSPCVFAVSAPLPPISDFWLRTCPWGSQNTNNP